MSDLSQRTQYGRGAFIYDWCANIGSLGAIPFIKTLHLFEVDPESSILYVGGGTCHEAVLAAIQGHCVTVLDSSESMLKGCRDRAEAAGVGSKMNFLHCDFLEFTTPSRFDAVVFHFFLDIFDLTMVNQVVDKGASLLSEHGRVFVADFSHPNGALPIRIFQWLYHQGGAAACWLLAAQPWLEIGDYATVCVESGLQIQSKRHVGLRGLGAKWFVFFSARAIERQIPKPTNQDSCLE